MYPKVHGWKWNGGVCSTILPYVCETRGMSESDSLTLVYKPCSFKLKILPVFSFFNTFLWSALEIEVKQAISEKKIQVIQLIAENNYLQLF